MGGGACGSAGAGSSMMIGMGLSGATSGTSSIVDGHDGDRRIKVKLKLLTAGAAVPTFYLQQELRFQHFMSCRRCSFAGSVFLTRVFLQLFICAKVDGLGSIQCIFLPLDAHACTQLRDLCECRSVVLPVLQGLTLLYPLERSPALLFFSHRRFWDFTGCLL